MTEDQASDPSVIVWGKARGCTAGQKVSSS